MAGWRLFLFGLITGLIASAVILILARGSPGRPVELLPPPDPPGIQVFVRGRSGARPFPRHRRSYNPARVPARGHSPRVNLKTASLAELDTLPGIGPTLAQRLLDERERHGPFTRVEDLLRVSGIGLALLEKIRDQVTLEWRAFMDGDSGGDRRGEPAMGAAPKPNSDGLHAEAASPGKKAAMCTRCSPPWSRGGTLSEGSRAAGRPHDPQGPCQHKYAVLVARARESLRGPHASALRSK